MNLIINQSEEIFDDFGTNTTESVIVGTDRLEVLNRIQSTFAREFEHMKNLKNQIFGLWIIKLNKHGQGWESILSIQIRFKSKLSSKNWYPQITRESYYHQELNPHAPRQLIP